MASGRVNSKRVTTHRTNVNTLKNLKQKINLIDIKFNFLGRLGFSHYQKIKSTQRVVK